jgi:hypothetical protein
VPRTRSTRPAPNGPCTGPLGVNGQPRGQSQFRCGVLRFAYGTAAVRGSPPGRSRVGQARCAGRSLGVVVEFLKAKWSPQQIASTLAFVFPDDPDMQVSHETIYTVIYAQPRGELCVGKSSPGCSR